MLQKLLFRGIMCEKTRNGSGFVTVTIICKCKEQFPIDVSSETESDKFITLCPNCGMQHSIRTKDVSVWEKKENNQLQKDTPPKEMAVKRVKLWELISSFAWILLGLIQLFFVYTALAGVWNIVNAVIRLCSIKNITLQNPEVVPYFTTKRKPYLIAFALANLILGAFVGLILVGIDWVNVRYVEKNKWAFEPDFNTSNFEDMDFKNAEIFRETIVVQGLCNRVKSAMHVQNGNAILTTCRFIYLKHSLMKTLTIGSLINLTAGDIDFDIRLSDISHIDNGQQGIGKTIRIHTKNGEIYNFYFAKRIEWEIALNNAIKDTKNN